MSEFINKRIDVFLGLNNRLWPTSPKYREGMASRSMNARIDESGIWSPRQKLVSCSDAPAELSAGAGGSHCKNLSVEDINKIVTNIGVSAAVDVGPNKLLYITTGSGAVKYKRADASGGTVTTYTPPAGVSVAEIDGTSSRAQNGTYWYMCTYFDNVRKRESLPSTIYTAEIDHDDGAKDNVQVTFPAASSATRVRIYRCLRTCAADGVYNATNIFYFLHEATSGTTYDDYQHDTEIMSSEYEGRGSAPPEDVDYLASFNNRMLYFKGSDLYWSSAGQPEEVAQKYTISYNGGGSAICKPKLSIGSYGEAKTELTEMSGHKILGSMVKDGKLWIWTASMTAYIEATNRLEGYHCRVVVKGVGVANGKTLAGTPYGIFGADQQGIWLLQNTNVIRRLTDNVIDIHGSGDTRLTQSGIADSFGVWIPGLNEYWWCASGIQIVYQANRGIFVGPYNYSLSNGCSFVSDGGAQAFLNSGETPSLTSKDIGIQQNYEFWLGQSESKTVKDQVVVEIVHCDDEGSADAEVFQNSIASETGAEKSQAYYGTDTPIGRISPPSSGRLFKLKLNCSGGRRLTTINYRYNALPEIL